MLCNSENILEYLIHANKNNLRLKVDNYNSEPALIDSNKNSNYLVVIENTTQTTSIIAVNYANSINSNIRIIPASGLTKDEIDYYIESWKENDDIKYFEELKSLLFPNIEKLNLVDYSYATFFTEGIPYSLIFENIIPISHVHLQLRPDFFIFNNIYFENNEQLYSAIVFSPAFFTNEETQKVIEYLSKANYYIFTLVDEEATPSNIDYAVQILPYSLLHFCSHGGKVDGHKITMKFNDKNNEEHTVEFDEVVSIMPERGKELIKVIFKNIFRKFDGLDWKSKEFKEKDYPHHVFVDMQKAISEEKNHLSRIPINDVPNSSTISCKNFYYQAMFNFLCDNHSPIIFNNTCWSNSDIKSHFIAEGAKGYIGTLWSINNKNAVTVSNLFYKNLFSSTILMNLFQSINAITEKEDKDVYIYWGLPFCSIKEGKSILESKFQLIFKIKNAMLNWTKNYEKSTNPKTKETIKDYINFLNKGILEILK